MKRLQSHAYLNRTSTAFVVMGIALTVYLLVKSVIVFTTPETVWTTPKTIRASQSTQLAAGAPVFDFTRDPFHPSQTVEVAAPVKIGEDAPETNLNLTLTGMRYGERGSAVLRTPDNTENIYEIGEDILPGVRLKAVNQGYIVIEQNGQLERLTFEQSETSTLMSVQAPEVPVVLGPSAKGSPKLTFDSLFQAVQITPAENESGVIGYKITPRSAGLDLGAFGLQSGDIVTRIGSEDLTQGRPEWPVIFSQMRNAPSVSLQVLRDGQTVTINIGTQ